MKSIKYSILIAYLCFAFGCDVKPNQGKAIGKDTLINEPTFVDPNDYGISKDSIQGLWAKSDHENASFRIKGDSLYLFENPEAFYFEIKSDSFIYYMGNHKFTNRILKIGSDSIIFVEYGEVVKLINLDKPNSRQ